NCGSPDRSPRRAGPVTVARCPRLAPRPRQPENPRADERDRPHPAQRPKGSTLRRHFAVSFSYQRAVSLLSAGPAEPLAFVRAPFGRTTLSLVRADEAAMKR